MLAMLLIGIWALAQENKPKPAEAAAPAANPAKPVALTPDERALYTSLVRSEVELSAQLKLLTALIDDHAKRADEASKTGTPEKTKWELDLLQELRAQNSTVLAQLNDLTKQRLDFEKARAPAPPALPGIGGLEQARPLNADEWTYLSKLDEALLKVRQELSATDEAAKGLQSQLLTNTTTEAVVRVSALLDENIRLAKQWERELSGLELKKLEFRALRR